MAVKIKNTTLFKAMEKWAPLQLAYEWDNVGLQIGSYDQQAKKVMITLDVLESVVDEAIEKDVNLIIAHHPLFFKSITDVNIDSPKGKVIQKLIKHDITVYAAHTNLDIATGGVNDLLCDALSIHPTENLVDLHSEKLFKIVVYVPMTHLDEISEALHLAGAGHIGNYSHCTFRTEGQGTFKPLEGSTPFIGTENEVEIVKEMKVETIVNEQSKAKVIDTMIHAHPYEEVAYDVYPLHNEGESLGIGRVGQIAERMDLRQFATYVKDTLDLSHVRVIGDLEKPIEKVAVLGGSGEKYIKMAKHAQADVYLTGDLTFHAAQDAKEMGLAVIDAGHYIEKIMKDATKEWLDKKFIQSELDIIVSETSTDPFQWI